MPSFHILVMFSSNPFLTCKYLIISVTSDRFISSFRKLPELNSTTNSVMILRIWIFLLSPQLYALVTKSSQYATKSMYKTPLTTGPVHQEPPSITTAPDIDAAGIRARADIVTCAYVSGNPGKLALLERFISRDQS
jgi:hypothetical protein